MDIPFFAILPIFGIEMQGVEYENGSTPDYKPGETPRIP
jgi:hypothetical protein